MKLHEREYEFACIVWDNEPLSSRALARLCEEKMGWKRTTTYTVLRKLCEKGVLKNDHALVTSLVKKEAPSSEIISLKPASRSICASLPLPTVCSISVG